MQKWIDVAAAIAAINPWMPVDGGLDRACLFCGAVGDAITSTNVFRHKPQRSGAMRACLFPLSIQTINRAIEIALRDSANARPKRLPGGRRRFAPRPANHRHASAIRKLRSTARFLSRHIAHSKVRS